MRIFVPGKKDGIRARIRSSSGGGGRRYIRRYFTRMVFVVREAFGADDGEDLTVFLGNTSPNPTTYLLLLLFSSIRRCLRHFSKNLDSRTGKFARHDSPRVFAPIFRIVSPTPFFFRATKSRVSVFTNTAIIFLFIHYIFFLWYVLF